MDPVRIVAFCSHYLGSSALDCCLSHSEWLQIPLVVTDDPEKTYTNAKGRLWADGFDNSLRQLVRTSATTSRIPVYDDRVNCDAFLKLISQIEPKGILVSCFGQRLPASLLDFVHYRAFNIHPVVPGEGLEATRGPQPFSLAVDIRATQIQLAIHRMSAQFDDGEILARGTPLDFPSEMAQWIQNRPKFGRNILAFWKDMAATLPPLLHDQLPRLFR